ncbi:MULTISPECIES: hypothetical protein [Blautia]|uniref:hypothetical protein n=1 Tax=Blautia TaxID=572511 RepID=UPI000BA31EEC|nr:MULTISPECIES: hypothetical protein [Blautia]
MSKIKKVLGIMLGVMLLCSQALLVSAAPVDTVNVERQYLENGDYIETVISEYPIASYASNSKSGSKTSTYYNSDDVALWYVKVTGSFTYTGSSVRCTGASVSADSYSSYWGISNRSSSYSGNIATAKATGTHYFGNAVVERVNETVNLSCSVNGSLY